MTSTNHLDDLTEAEFDAMHTAHFAPRRHGDSKLEQPPAAELVRSWNAAHAATGIGEEVENEPAPSAWDRWSRRLEAWIRPAPVRFWSIYLAVLAASVAVGLWLRS